MEYFGFWICMAVVYASEAWLYSQGHDTFFHSHKTEAEKAIRDRQAGLKDN